MRPALLLATLVGLTVSTLTGCGESCPKGQESVFTGYTWTPISRYDPISKSVQVDMQYIPQYECQAKQGA